MARYEGMDELLQQVRERLAEKPAEPARPLEVQPQAEMPVRNESYLAALNAVLLLVHDMDQLRDVLAPEELSSLTQAQCGELRLLLGKVLHEVQGHQMALQRVSK